jgi:hypothetical protein
VTLSAYVQLVNCLESLGRTSEIRPALQRAEWLTDKIEPAEFSESLVHSDVKDWHKVFAWLGDTRSAGQVVE